MNAIKHVLCTSNAKTVKGEKKGWFTSVLYLAPHTLSGVNVCSHATPSCIDGCLNTAGRGQFKKIQQSRIIRTQLLNQNREAFIEILVSDIRATIRKAERLGMSPCIRLNGTSDLPWENIRINSKNNAMQEFNDIQWYDYTKVPIRMKKFLSGGMPENYHLTFSRSGSNDSAVKSVLDSGGNVAVVFRKYLPADWMGKKVINGDESDLRFLDPAGVVVGLKAKGRARSSGGDFVVD
jgi:hypothetical protein